MESVVAPGPRTKPEGGFVAVRVWLLAAAWWCYQSGRVTPRALRVFLGLHEMQARRCELERGRTPHYSLDELQGLVGGVGGAHLRRDLNQLKQLGLIRRGSGEGGGEAAFTWATSIEDLGIPLGEFHPWFEEHFENRARLVPLPRRLIRFLAGSGTRALLATTLGHAIRMLYLRNNQVDPRGRCKASWVAAAFGVSLSSVERARARLLELGVLQSGDDGSAKERWARRRWGGCFYWNLQWEDVPVCRDNDRAVSTGTPQDAPTEGGLQRKPETETVANSDTGLGGVSGFSTTSLGGARENRHPLRGSKNQQPTSGRPGAGVSKQDPVGEGGREPSAKTARPRLQHIEEADLTNPERLLELHSQAQKAGLIGSAEADLLRFAALAEHAHAYGTTNRGGLFARLLGLWGTAPKWHFITQFDEDRATRRLKEHALQKEPGWEQASVAEPEQERQTASSRQRGFSEDARFVQLLRRTLAQRGITTGVFSHLRRFRPEWTRERWDAACRELAPRPPVGEEREPQPVRPMLQSMVGSDV